MQEMKNDEIEVDLKELFFVFWGKLWIILLSGIVLGIAAYFYTSVMITPQYASDGTVYILTRSNSNQQVTTGDLNMSAQLTSDFEELIISHTVLDEVIEQIDYEGLTFGSLKNKITVTNRTDTRILQITVTDPDPLMAKAIVDKVIEISSEKIKSIMDIEAVNLVDEGTLNSTPVSPSYKKNVLIGVLIGIVITSAIVIVMYLLDDKIHTGEDIEKYLGLSVLGVIPEVSNEKKKMRRKGVK
ncbi:MAG TPA: protein-tyrosine kinase [Candidatus Fimimorpha faecalis]|uniref:Protein-tyrosine kinase n=1 Tax=Candidatus Fimimorpha faecalis TaxID=2840824 RepID=A0A9D1EC10_9FIRM|nr:protein-tyrosine kinase [Candidatus Fimimorpha faecalis]